MHRKFIAFVVGVSLVITGLGAAPARADDDDLARALAAIVGIAIIGAAIKDRNDDRYIDRNRHVYRNYQEPTRPRYKSQARPRHQSYAYPRPLPHRVNRKLLPGDCLRSFDTRRGTMRMFGEQCLRQNYRYVNQLPGNCAVKLRTRHGNRWGYDARCLRQNGYQLARR